jgi:histidine kinase
MSQRSFSQLMHKELNASSAALVGRNEELAELVEIFNTVVEGNCCLAVFIGGYTGVGKTRLVGHFLATLESQMMVCTGQYDQFSKTAGIYSGLVDALNDLCLSISPTEELRAKLTEALGDDIKVLCDLISKSCRLLGVEESFSNSCRLETFLDLDADDTKTSRLDQATGFTRLKIAIQAFLRVLASEQPIVIFLDDFHRADSATLALFEFVLSDATTENIMFIATFRDHEVDLDYPLHLGMTTLQGAITTMKIGGLPLDDVNSLISNILNGDKTKTMELAKVIYRKTEGNAYFTIQLLELLSRQGILQFNGLSYSWEWDIDQADSETDLADTVVAIVAKKIEELDNMTKEVLKIASCLGSRFDGNVVQEIYVAMNGPLPDDTHSIRLSFQTAVKKGLINACSRTEPIYRWGHDRCQQTAYLLIAGQERSKIDDEITLYPEQIAYHYQIGIVLRDLYRNADWKRREWHLLVGTEQLNLGRSLLKCEQERIDLARMNLEAARKVQHKSAFFPACSFLNSSLELLGEAKWTEKPETVLEVTLLLAEMQYCTGCFIKSYATIDEILAKTSDVEGKHSAYIIKMQCLTAQRAHREVIGVCLKVASEIGLARLPTSINKAAVLIQLIKVKRAVAKFGIQNLLSHRDCNDKEVLLTIDLLRHASVAAWCEGLSLVFALTSCHMVRLTIMHGITKYAPFALCCWGMLINASGDHAYSFTIGTIALNLSERLKIDATRILVLYGNFIHHMFNPLQECVDYSNKSYRLGMASGDIMFGLVAALLSITARFYCSHPLEILIAVARSTLQEMIYYEQHVFRSYVALFGQFMCNLQGPNDSANPAIPEGEIVSNLKEFIARHQDGFSRVGIANVGMMTAYIFGDLDRARDSAMDLLSMKNKTFPLFSSIFFPFFRCLTWLGLVKRGEKKFMRRANREITILSKWIKSGFVNVPHLLLLLQAEKLSITSRDTDAVKKAFCEAIKSSAKRGFSLFCAIGNERAGVYFLDHDHNWSAFYIDRALALYRELGAEAKAQWCITQYNITESSLSTRLRGTLLRRQTEIDAEIEMEKHNKSDWINTFGDERRRSLRKSITLIFKPTAGSRDETLVE